MADDVPDGPRALVTGAGGVLGSVLVRHLSESGWSVRALTRRPPAGPARAEWVVADVLDTDALRRAATGMDVVFHLAALVERAPRRWSADDYTRVNVGGTASLVKAARDEGVGRIVYFSSTAVYGAAGERPATEQSTPAPSSPYARSKLQGEQVVLDGVTAVVLRIAAVYGPHVEGRFLRLARLHRFGFVQVTGANLRTLVFEDDLVRATIEAARHPAASGRVFNVTDGAVHSIEAITSAMRAALGCTFPAMRLSIHRLESLAASVRPSRPEGVRWAFASAVGKLAEHSAVDGSAIERELGFAPRFTLQDGWRETVAGWRARGLL